MNHNMRRIFLSFPGYNVGIKQKIKKINDFEFWNLEKIDQNEFIKLIRKKIKPINKNVVKNYFTTRDEGAYKEAYKESAWGMLLPDFTKDPMGSRYESLFLVNLFSKLALPVTFYVSRMGIMVEKTKLSFSKKAIFHGEDNKFTNKRFIQFYNLLFPEVMGTSWHADEVLKWGREDWRLSIACSSFSELSKYQKVKYPMRWQEECADIAAFYETLLSRKKNDGGYYKIIQRIEVLLSDHYKDKFGGIKKGLKDLFDYRNEFVHGSFFDRLKKETKAYSDNSKMAQLPGVDFRFLEKQVEVARKVFISFFYLKKKFKKTNKPTPELINSAIMDINLRKKIQRHTNDIMKLLSEKA